MDWQSIETAPRDGTPILVRIPGHGDENVVWWEEGYLNSAGEDCGCWAFLDIDGGPKCWTDGVCWEVNEYGIPSVKPTHWAPIPEQAVRKVEE